MLIHSSTTEVGASEVQSYNEGFEGCLGLQMPPSSQAHTEVVGLQADRDFDAFDGRMNHSIRQFKYDISTWRPIALEALGKSSLVEFLHINTA